MSYKLVNFENTINELKLYLSIPVQNKRDVAGIIQAFEFTFEQSWKSIQKIASDQGVEVGSPKTAFSFALQNAWIESNQEQEWLQMLKDRNLTTHTYQENLALEILERIRRDYCSMFEALLKSLKAVG